MRFANQGDYTVNNNKAKSKLPIITQLVQLQELLIAKKQQEASSPEGAHTEKLDEAIVALAKALPPPVLAQFQRLLKRDPQAIVPIENGICTGCGVALPIALTHQVHAADDIYHCPECARLLFYREKIARNIRKAARRNDAPLVGIARYSAETLMIPDLQAKDCAGAIRELALQMQEEGFVDDTDTLVTAALQREAIVSTAVGHGIAFPHVRSVEGGGLTLALGISKEGIPFDASNPKELVHVVFFMVIPTAASAFYLKLLSTLSRTFASEAARQKLLDADTPDKLWKELDKLTQKGLA